MHEIPNFPFPSLHATEPTVEPVAAERATEARPDDKSDTRHADRKDPQR